MNGWIEDLRSARRALLRRPGMTFVALLTLALGIGANSAIFTAVEGVLLHPLPYRDADRIVYPQLQHTQGSMAMRVLPSASILRAWREQATSFEQIEAFKLTEAVLDRDDSEKAVLGAQVSPRFFTFLGVAPSFGRGFADDEARPGNGRVVVLADALWKKWGADPDVLGQTVLVNGDPHTVVGVLPRRAAHLIPVMDIQLWTPLALTDEGQERLHPIGRLKEGVSVRAAQAELATILEGLKASGEAPNGMKAMVGRASDWFNRSLPRVILLFQGAVGLVLLIACSNVAHLLLAQGESRRRELAMRTVLGAGRWLLMRQLLIECLVLSFLGGCLGLLLATFGLKALVAMLPAGLEHLRSLALNPSVLAATTLVSLLTGLAFGLLPALQGSIPDVADSLRQCSTGAGGSRRRGWLRQGLILFEVALAFMLLIGAGLLVKSIFSLLGTDTAFAPENLLVADLEVDDDLYGQADQVAALVDQVLARSEGLAEHVALADAMPPEIAGVLIGSVEAEGRTAEGEPPLQILNHSVVSPDYFRTLDIRLLAGRDFTELDGSQAEGAVILNESMAKLFFPGETAAGRRIRVDGGEWLRVVGVVADVHQSGLRSAADSLQIYQPFRQAHGGSISVALRAAGGAGRLADDLKARLGGSLPGVEIRQIGTMQERLWNSIQGERFQTLLMMLFAGMAVVLTVVGIYGVVACTVSERTREVGIRMALGARSGQVVTHIVRRSMVPVALGMAAGLGGALALARLLEGLVYGIGVRDPGTFIAVSLLVLSITCFASWLPARQAAALEPVAALRHD